MKVCGVFFEMPEEEKKKMGGGKHVLDPIRCGTSFNTAVDKMHYWRDFLKVFAFPDFYSPTQPTNFRNFGFGKLVQNLEDQNLKKSRIILFLWIKHGHKRSDEETAKGICESSGLEPTKVEEALQLNHGLQILVANLYPTCPQPDLALGMPAHADHGPHGLFIILMQNDVGGLQLIHNGKWVQVDPVPNSFLVNTGDHMEILSNGRYKSVLRRAIVNSQSTRISVVMAHGPALEEALGPMLELVEDTHPPPYHKMNYKDYFRVRAEYQP